MLNKNIIEYSHRESYRKAKKPLSVEVAKAIRWLIVTLTSMIVVLSIAFFIFTGQSAQKGYALQQEKLRYEELKSQLESINAKISTSVNFSGIEESTNVQNMTASEHKTFVTPDDNKIN